jgi:pimeloyl-ACP methyl ester carboxylesterase
MPDQIERALRGLGGQLSGRVSMLGLTRKVLLPNAGHWVQQERPAEVTELMLHFLRQTKS